MADVRNFVEKSRDEYNNRGYTPDQPYVIKARYEAGSGKAGTLGSVGTLHILEPDHIKEKWSTLSELYWQATDLPVGPLTEEEWLAEVTKST